MDRRPLLLAAVLALAVVATTVAVPAMVSARPAYEIPVTAADDPDSLDSAEGEAWTEVPAAGVPLSSAGAAVPGGDDTTVENVRVASARTDERLYVRLSWEDGTRDTGADDVREFPDAVAVQLPANESARPPITMGSTDNPVNVWYWNGANASQELLAGGPGTTTTLTDSELRTAATYDGGRWRVVFSRPLAGASENRTTITGTRDVDVAVAVWNGSNMERSGQKATSEWYYLALGPGPQGPPYEAILWTVAGVAIVLTTLVTIEGVRRTRGE
ncbi:ethylbenzene dehydrogenase-related protein [Halobellus limi]|uniref:Complex iron-sulfur molybdoenzyme family reductase subunit gamma n=1 Tax=Halobellus limi TaxID=699433 RepID=A0A1H5TD62_9EURY|nr:ethylbenzene dehydrogenase-related protein [Halobellus limi]QCC47341.1 DMSO reductase [Halobellus limi]SEF60710.1 complex iron-sulfur molybdoenzyme family reductase subunit gamma [Halobellus limi]